MLVLQGVQGPHAQHRTCFSLWLLPCKPSPAPPGTTTAGRIDQTRHWRASRRRLPSCRPAPQLSFHPQRPRPRLRRPVRLRCEGQDDGDSSSSAGGGGGGGKRPPKKQSGKPFQWLRQALSGLRTQRAARVVFNVGALLLLMRLWPLNGRHPLSGDGATIPIDVRSPLAAHALIAIYLCFVMWRPCKQMHFKATCDAQYVLITCMHVGVRPTWSLSTFISTCPCWQDTLQHPGPHC